MTQDVGGPKSKGSKDKSAPVNKDLEFLQGVESGASAKDIVKKVLGLLKAVVEVEGFKQDMFCAACQASAKLCESTKGFVAFFKGGGVETLMQTLKEPPTKDKEAKAALKDAVKESCKGATAWFQEMDYVNFKEMGNFTYVSCWLVMQDENLSLEILDLIHRSALLRTENCPALIQGGAFAVVHKIIGSHRAPELVEEALMILCRLSDLPFEAMDDYVMPFLLHEKDLVQTVVESLGHAPLNVRLQLTGLRLLSIWAKHPNHEVRALLRKANAGPLLEGTAEKLSKAGFAHTASWVTAIATRPLQVALDPKEQKLAKLAGVEG